MIALAADAYLVPFSGLDPTFDRGTDTAPAPAFDALLQLMPRVAPAAEVAPVEFVRTGHAKKHEKALGPAGLDRFERKFVVGPRRIAEHQPLIGPHAGLNDLPVLDGPATARVLLEAAIPDHLAPQPAVGRMVDVLEEMPVDLLIDAIHHAVRVNRVSHRKRRLLLPRRNATPHQNKQQDTAQNHRMFHHSAPSLVHAPTPSLFAHAFRHHVRRQHLRRQRLSP